MNGLVEMFTGNKGGGKSYLAAERIYNRLRSGGWVYTNIEMHPDKIDEALAYEGLEFCPERLIHLGGSIKDFHQKIARGSPSDLVDVVLDEVHLDIDPKQRQGVPKEMLDIATLARKLDIDLVFISQSSMLLNKDFRRQVDRFCFCKNLGRWEVMGVTPCPIPLFIRIWQDTFNGEMRKSKTDFAVRQQWICDLYNSDAMLGDYASQLGSLKVLEANPLKRIPKRKRNESKAGMPWAEMLTASCAAFTQLF